MERSSGGPFLGRQKMQRNSGARGGGSVGQAPKQERIISVGQKKWNIRFQIGYDGQGKMEHGGVLTLKLD